MPHVHNTSNRVSAFTVKSEPAARKDSMKTRVLPLSVVGVLCLPEHRDVEEDRSAAGAARGGPAGLGVGGGGTRADAWRHLHAPGPVSTREAGRRPRGDRTEARRSLPSGARHDGRFRDGRRAGLDHARAALGVRDDRRGERRLRQQRAGLPVGGRPARRGVARAAVEQPCVARDRPRRRAPPGEGGVLRHLGHRRGRPSGPGAVQPSAARARASAFSRGAGAGGRRRGGMCSTWSSAAFRRPRPTSIWAARSSR